MLTHDKKKALVTGATGFIGSHLVKRLVANKWRVHVLLRKNSELSLLQNVAKDISIHIHDGSTEAMYQIVSKSQPDVVFHLAALVQTDHSACNIASLVQSNILFGTQLIQAMTACNVTKIINTGTYWQTYNSQDYNPLNLYAATKQAFQDILRFYQEASLLQNITLTLYDTYGPSDARQKVINLLKKAWDTGETLAMSAGEQFLDLVYIDDVISAYCVAADRILQTQGYCDERFDISSECPLTLKDVVRVFQQCSMRPLHVSFGEKPYRVREIMQPQFPSMSLPDWFPAVGLKEGITQILSEYSS